MPDPKPSPRSSATKDYLRYSGIGVVMALYVTAFTLLGHWLDGALGWKVPVCTIAGALAGVLGAILHLFRATRRH